MCNLFNQRVLECCSLQSSPCPAACFGQICLEWLCWKPPVPLGVFWTQALCVRWLQGTVTGFLCQPHPLSVHRSCLVVICTHSKSRGEELLTLSILKSVLSWCFTFWWFVFHYQWSAKALQERDCLPIPAYSSVEYPVTFVLLKGFPGMDSRDAI